MRDAHAEAALHRPSSRGVACVQSRSELTRSLGSPRTAVVFLAAAMHTPSQGSEAKTRPLKVEQQARGLSFGTSEEIEMGSAAVCCLAWASCRSGRIRAPIPFPRAARTQAAYTMRSIRSETASRRRTLAHEGWHE